MVEKYDIENYDMNSYLVQIGEGGRYLVDLDEFSHGYCACRDFECRYLPKLLMLQEQGATEFPKLECKHIKYLKNVLRARSVSND